MAVEEILTAFGDKFLSNAARPIMFFLIFLILRMIRKQLEKKNIKEESKE